MEITEERVREIVREEIIEWEKRQAASLVEHLEARAAKRAARRDGPDGCNATARASDDTTGASR